MICPKCKKEMPPEAAFCCFCGVSLAERVRTPKKRGNGQGTVYKLPNGKYIAKITVSCTRDENGVFRQKTKTKTYAKKTDAINALAKLTEAPVRTVPTLRQLYDKWLPTHKAGKQTLDCYKAAFKYFNDIEIYRLDSITIEDYQECIDECGHGRRTQENMRTCLSLMFKYGIPRHLIPDDLNLAQFLHVGGEAAAHRDAFTDVEIEKIRRTKTPEAEDVLMMIYLGFRPSEYLSLTTDNYDRKNRAFRAGAKTEAGINRTVPVSSKILPLVTARIKRGGFIAQQRNGSQWPLKSFTERVFYKALDDAGIDNPMLTVAGDVPRHKYTPHSCRHTFATLMKRAAGSDTDKMALIGHASDEQLRDYQDVSFDDLRRITDAI